MSVQFCIYYFEQALILVPKNEDLPVKHKVLESKRLDLQLEEAKAWIIGETQSSFLHANDFRHLIIGNNMSLLPSSIFDLALLQNYHEKMHGPCDEGRVIKHSECSLFQTVTIEAMPFWAIELTNKVFNNHNVSSFFSESLNTMAQFTQERVAVILIHQDHFFLGVAESKKLLFADFIEYSTAEDIVFYTLNCLQKNEIVNNTGTVYLYDWSENTKTEETLSYFSQIEEMQQLDFQILPDVFQFSEKKQ